MDLRLTELAEISWEQDLRLVRAEGATERVLRARADQLLGQPLQQALGISRASAAELDALARRDRPQVEFLRAKLGSDHAWLRLLLRLSEGRPSATVMDLDSLLEGAPPCQLSRISSSLSHEIRNPLSSVKMAVQTLARNTGLSERDQRRLAIAHREIRAMERTLWLLSEYVRDTPPASESLPLRSLVQEAAALIEPELSERRIRLAIDSPEGSHPRASADPARLRPVLAQLIFNVAMGQPEGSTVEVRLEEQPGAVRVRIADPSASFPAEEGERLFEPFGSMLARGAGLSLAALQRVMTSHGGTATAESSHPGTLYTLTFPA